MFFWLVELSGSVPVFNVFRYITFRTGGAMATAALFVFLFGPWIIDHLRLRQGKGQPIREDGPQSHLIAKKGTPTMGGLMILSGLVVATLLWGNLRNPYVWIVLAVTLGFGFVGFYDDYLKVTKQSHAGFSGRTRLAIEAIIAGAACFAIIWIGRPSAVDRAGRAVPEGLHHRLRLVLSHLHDLHHRRRGQRREPDRRPRRPCHRAGDDRGGELRHDRLSRG